MNLFFQSIFVNCEHTMDLLMLIIYISTLHWYLIIPNNGFVATISELVFPLLSIQYSFKYIFNPQYFKCAWNQSLSEWLVLKTWLSIFVLFWGVGGEVWVMPITNYKYGKLAMHNCIARPINRRVGDLRWKVHMYYFCMVNCLLFRHIKYSSYPQYDLFADLFPF